MSTLAHVFEAEGMATVALGSIRKQIEGSAPPRGLWCDFPLGRPLGKPGDPEFQHRVLDVAFALLQLEHSGRIRFVRDDDAAGRDRLIFRNLIDGSYTNVTHVEVGNA